MNEKERKQQQEGCGQIFFCFWQLLFIWQKIWGWIYFFLIIKNWKKKNLQHKLIIFLIISWQLV
jgi:hypothetical protein